MTISSSSALITSNTTSPRVLLMAVPVCFCFIVVALLYHRLISLTFLLIILTRQISTRLIIELNRLTAVEKE